MNHLDSWEKGLQSRLANHQTPPPAMGWEKLEEALKALPQAEDSVAVKPVRQRPFYLRPAFVTTLLSAAACATMAFLLFPDSKIQRDTVQNIAQVTEKAEGSAKNNEVFPNSTAPMVAVTETETGVAKQGAKVMPSGGRSAFSKSKEIWAIAANKLAASSAEQSATDEDFVETASKKMNKDSAEKGMSKEGEEQAVSILSEQDGVSMTRTRSFKAAPRTFKNVTALSKKQAARIPRMAVHASTNPSDRKNSEGYYGTSSLAGDKGTLWGGIQGGNDMAMVYAQNFNREVNTHVKHGTPFQLGLSVSIPFTDRWAFTTGLTYTRLSTDIESGSDESYYVTTQRLHYVGLPLQASYTFFHSRPFNAYITAGGEIEKCVKGEQSTTFNVSENYRSSAKNRSDLGKGLWQLSFNLSAGLQFNITKNLGLYFEPGVAYYVSDGSSLPSIRHDKPWQFNMQGGLRFSIFPQ